LTEFGVKSGEMNNTKVVENFEAFPESSNTPSYDQRCRSYDLCMLRVLLKFSSEQNQDTWTILEFKPTSKGKLEEP
jgi:hypothetical protein